MKRRTFIQSILGFLVLPFLPKAKAKGLPPTFDFTRFEQVKELPNNPKGKIKWRRYEALEPSTEPLFDEEFNPTKIYQDSVQVSIKEFYDVLLDGRRKYQHITDQLMKSMESIIPEEYLERVYMFTEFTMDDMWVKGWIYKPDGKPARGDIIC